MSANQKDVWRRKKCQVKLVGDYKTDIHTMHAYVVFSQCAFSKGARHTCIVPALTEISIWRSSSYSHCTRGKHISQIVFLFPLPSYASTLNDRNEWCTAPSKHIFNLCILNWVIMPQNCVWRYRPGAGKKHMIRFFKKTPIAFSRLYQPVRSEKLFIWRMPASV